MRYLTLLILFLVGATAEPLKVEQLFNVTTVKVAASNAQSESRDYGYVAADEGRRYDVTPRFGGYVESLYATERYRFVKKGDPLVRVYSPEVLRAKEEYRSSLRFYGDHGNKAMLQSAREKLELLGIPDAEINAVADPATDLRHTTVLAPVSGYLFEKALAPGAAFNAKTRLFEIVNLDTVWVEARVQEEKLAAIGSSRFFIASKTLEGRRSATEPLIYPQLSAKEALATVRLKVANADGKLFPGMYVTVFSVSGGGEVLSLPKTAVIRKEGHWYAFVVGEYEGEYTPTEVQVRPLDDTRYAIVSGLEADQEVVANALFMMDSDAQINGLY